ncbi:BTG1-like protein [Mya arenaria]|uniref:BTG1-like protein n=1 Tax=Mya arenaria TaxID=6604 RepID=A0ABY7FS92_MYAAR|nr:protein BTG2-like [Mya arenaria]WAR25027.1 BTG1-like protein [Mya arenaria]
MKDEIKSAVDFLTNILRSRDNVNEKQRNEFNTILRNLLSARFQGHWFPQNPMKGSGYRCIRLNHNMDPLILQAGETCGLNCAFLESTFPRELTIWVDPRDVSFRIGEDGSVGILFQSENTSSQLATSDLSPIHHSNKNLSSTLMSCKDQFMNALPSLASESLHYKQFAGFVSS